MDWPKDWRLRLRYGKLKTAFHHFTVIGDGEVTESNSDFGTTKGSPALFTIKVWAVDSAEAIDVLISVGRQVGFDVDGEIQVYETAADQPPGDNPYAYDLGFQQYVRD